MGRTYCIHLDIGLGNSDGIERWIEYCKHFNCEVSAENGIRCDTCKEYETGFQLPTECIYYEDCKEDGRVCGTGKSHKCIGYQEEP